MLFRKSVIFLIFFFKLPRYIILQTPFFLATALGLCLVLGADLGGLMVYQYGVAVNATSETPIESHTHAAHTHSH